MKPQIEAIRQIELAIISCTPSDKGILAIVSAVGSNQRYINKAVC